MGGSGRPASWKSLESRAEVSLPPQDLWRPLSLFNFYRLFLGCLFIFLVGLFGNTLSLGSSDLPLFFRASIIYVVMVLVSQLATRLRQPRFGLQLAFQVGTDVACITVLSHASGGVQSNLGMLLLVSLAAAGLISRGRTTLFFAALASIAALLQHSYAVLNQEAEITQYVQVGLLSIAYFAIAWLAHTLAKYAIASEDLAVRRGVDLANMAEANRLAIQDMPDGVLVVDERGVVRQHNPSAERLLGYQFPEAGEVTLEDCSPLLMERLAAWRQNHGHESEVLRLGAIGHRLRVRFLPVQREGFWGAVLFIEDIQRMQAQAQQIKLAALGRLTANVAHEVRNPLSAISYATELLQEGAHEPAQERMFQIIMDNAARLNRIVQDVMQLNRRDRVQAEPLLLADLLPGFIAGLSQAERVERSVFSIEAEEACVVNFDRGHLDQILWNLCCNALRYCRKLTGSIKLSVWRMGEGRVILDIIDDGPGVAPEVVPQLFEPFFTTATGGAGLGLYIARELSEANGATLDYWRQEGSGACFRIVFGGQDEH